MKANTIIARITRAVESLRAACAPVSPERGDVAAATERLFVPLRGNPSDAPILVTSTMTGSFTVIDCAMTGRRS